MGIQDWQTAVRLCFQKCNFPVEVEDRIQRDIFVIGLNDAFKRFRSDVISRETFATLTFSQVIAKARDFENGLKTELSIAQHHLEEAVNKISSNKIPQALTSQRRLHDVIRDMEGVLNIFNDIIVIGRVDSIDQGALDHDKAALGLLRRLTSHNLKLNPDKIRFKSQSAPFMGHVLTSDGLKPSPEISKAVLDMPQPEDKAATRRFLGTIMYFSKFCPYLSRVVDPLRDLTHLNQQFIWADQHTKAFQEAKHLVSTAPCLYFGMNSPDVLQVGASDYGLGAVLLQPSLSSTESSEIEWQPVAHSSSSLTPTEKGYAQIEKETLAIVHAFHKFNQQLFGKADIIVHTNHKPLEVIFKRSLASAPAVCKVCCSRYSGTVSGWSMARAQLFLSLTRYLEHLANVFS